MNLRLMRSWLRPAACLAVMALSAGAESKADFTYSTVPSPSGYVFGGSTVATSGVSSSTTLTTPTLANIANVSDVSNTNPPATDTATIPFSDVITINNIPGSGTSATGTITVFGTLAFTRSDTGGEVSTFTPGSPSYSAVIGGVTYTVSQFTYAAPTVNSSAGIGNISALISSGVVPEPSSITMMGLGLAGVGFVAARRRRSAV